MSRPIACLLGYLYILLFLLSIYLPRFPKKPERLAAWVAVVNKKDWTPKSSSRICSAHFKEEDIDRTSLSVVRIREHAVPTIFPRCQAFPCPCVQRKVVSPFCHQYIK
uniref:THAP-type domain-containing protein n=1 Tax=Cacopsylla melanoneura TaxID=428564 RepID=A0A8D8WX84_9HEMI